MAGEDTYYAGECVWYVAHELAWVRGGWGNARDWPARARAAGFYLSDTPFPGAVVCYGPGAGYSEFGHVAIVREVYGDLRFLVSEMNYVGWNVVDQRVSNSYDVAGFILPPAGAPLLGGGAQESGGGAGEPDAATAWGELQDYWNRVLPGATAALQWQAGQLRGLFN